jgi:hypothetical protein
MSFAPKDDRHTREGKLYPNKKDWRKPYLYRRLPYSIRKRVLNTKEQLEEYRVGDWLIDSETFECELPFDCYPETLEEYDNWGYWEYEEYKRENQLKNVDWISESR